VKFLKGEFKPRAILGMKFWFGSIILSFVVNGLKILNLKKQIAFTLKYPKNASKTVE
jgi:hypothetical protein